MKKIVGILAAAAFAATAFAEVNIGLSANQAFAPIAYDGDDMVTYGPAATWCGFGTSNRVGRVGISFKAENDVAGVVTDIHTEDFSKDNAYGWVKPYSFLKLNAGRMDGNWKRLGFGYGAWNTLRPSGIGHEGDDLAFWRPRAGSYAPNFAVLVTPIEGLEFNYDCELTITEDGKVEKKYKDADGNDQVVNTWGPNETETNYLYNALWNHARFGASYTIADVGTIMAQVWGKNKGASKGDTEYKNWGVINAAFQLTAVEGLDAQFGVRLPTTFKPTALEGKTVMDEESAIQFGAGVNYKFEPVALHAFFDGRMASDDVDSYNKFGFGIGGGVDFAITDAYSLVADVRYYSKWYKVTEEGKDHVVLYGGMEHHLTNATVKLGFAGSTNNGKDSDAFTFGVPLVLDISF